MLFDNSLATVVEISFEFFLTIRKEILDLLITIDNNLKSKTQLYNQYLNDINVDLKELQKDINKLMAEVTNKDEKFWKRMNRNDTYLDAKQCLEYGIIDKII